MILDDTLFGISSSAAKRYLGGLWSVCRVKRLPRRSCFILVTRKTIASASRSIFEKFCSAECTYMTGCPSCERTPPMDFSEASVVTVASFSKLYGCTSGSAHNSVIVSSKAFCCILPMRNCCFSCYLRVAFLLQNQESFFRKNLLAQQTIGVVCC